MPDPFILITHLRHVETVRSNSGSVWVWIEILSVKCGARAYSNHSHSARLSSTLPSTFFSQLLVALHEIMKLHETHRGVRTEENIMT